MAVSDYLVTVLSRESKTIRVQLRLARSGPTMWVGLFPAFIQGLLFPEDWDERDGPPNKDVYSAWSEKREEEIEDGEFDAREEIVSVQVVEGGPDKPWPTQMPLDPSDEEADAILGPPVVLEIKVERAGMLAHLKAGDSWKCYRPDYYGDAEFRGGPDALRAWKRGPKPAKPKPPPPPPRAAIAALARVVEETEGSLVVEYVTMGEMPSLDLVRWCYLLRPAYPKLDNVHPDVRVRMNNGAMIKGATLLSLGEAPAEVAADMDVMCPKMTAAERKRDGHAEHIDLRPSAVHGVYRLEIHERAWLAEHSTYNPHDKWFRPGGDPLSRMPKPTSASELEEFRELLELARMDGPASVVDMLFDGLNGTFDIVQLALKEALVVDAPITRLEGRLGRLIGSYDMVTACAALQVAKRIASEALLGSVVLATWRLEPEVASAAVEALRAIPGLPTWAEKRLVHEPFLPPGVSSEEAVALLHRAYDSSYRPHRF